MLGHYKGGRGARSRRADASRAPRSRCPRGASTLLADSEEVEGGEEAAADAKDGVHEVAGDGGNVDAGEGGVEKAVVAEDEPVLVVEEVVLELALEDGGKTVHVIVEERREQLRQGRRRGRGPRGEGNGLLRGQLRDRVDGAQVVVVQAPPGLDPREEEGRGEDRQGEDRRRRRRHRVSVCVSCFRVCRSPCVAW